MISNAKSCNQLPVLVTYKCYTHEVTDRVFSDDKSAPNVTIVPSGHLDRKFETSCTPRGAG